MERKGQYETLIDNLPAGLDRAILRILSQHQGAKAAIKKQDILLMLKTLGFKPHERQFRMAVKELRRAGHLIGCEASEDGGYFMCSSRAEFDEFADSEFRSKIRDMSETVSAMEKTARQTFGEWNQPQLI